MSSKPNKADRVNPGMYIATRVSRMDELVEHGEFERGQSWEELDECVQIDAWLEIAPPSRFFVEGDYEYDLYCLTRRALKFHWTAEYASVMGSLSKMWWEKN